LYKNLSVIARPTLVELPARLGREAISTKFKQRQQRSFLLKYNLEKVGWVI